MANASRGTGKITIPADEEILITREFNAPKHLVYKAWTTPELVRRWWGGRQHQMKVAEIDLRVGGQWRYVLEGDGFEVAFHGQFRELVANERIVTTEVYEMPNAAPLPAELEPLNIVTFTEVKGRTRLELLVKCANKELRDRILNSGMETGMQEQYDVLEELAISLG